MAIASKREFYHPENVRPHARDFCARSIALTLIVLSLIGLICGIIAYHAATNGSTLTSFSSVTLENSYFMMGGFSLVFLLSASALAYFVKKP